MHKRHINEFRKTELANTGRAAGMGIVEDNYSDESLSDLYNRGSRVSPFEHKEKRIDGEVIITRLQASTSDSDTK